jgi:MFS family permease
MIETARRTMAVPEVRRSRAAELSGTTAVAAVAAMIGVLFAGSTVLTPLYVIYKQQMGFSQIMLTLIYAAYVCGNLLALFVFGGMSDRVGRRRIGIAALVVAIVSAGVFMVAGDVAALFIGRILSGLGIGVGVGTGTAWLAELIADDDKSRASTIATSTNFVGLGVGALVAGLLAEYAPLPLELPFCAYLVALIVAIVLVARTSETVPHPSGQLWVRPRPRLSVPEPIRAQFVAPAITGFGAMALVGFFAALTPSILVADLHETSHAVAGAVFCELAAVVAATIVLTHALSSRAAMLTSLALMVPSVAALVLAQLLASMPLMLAAAALCGVASGLGYRGSLQEVNQIAPAERRAEVVSAYFVCGFTGNAVPVIGVGVIGTFAGSAIASLVFAATIVVFALVAFMFGLKYRH